MRQTDPVRAVAFDAVGTLFHSRGSIGNIYRTVALRYGSDIPARALEEGFTRRTRIHGTPVEKAGWRSLVQDVFREHGPFPEFEAFFEDVYAFFRSGKSWMCYPETHDVLAGLRGAGLRMAVVSNFDSRLIGVLRDLAIAEYFDAVVTPDSAGQAKPDPRIFLDATAQLGVSPSNTLFAGDDPNLDVQAAEYAGLRGVLIDRSDGGPRPGAVADLSGILPLVGAP